MWPALSGVNRAWSRLATSASLFVGSWGAIAWPMEAPVAVAPGGTRVALVRGSCPTFHWGEVAGASAYELTIFRAERPAPVELFRIELPGSAQGWTPAVDRCLEPGGDYAWAIRAIDAWGEPSPWSDARLFRIAAGPDRAEVEEAMAVLQRYLEAGGAAGEDARDEPESLASEAPTKPVAGTDLARASSSALVSGTVPPRTVTPPGVYALSIDGAFDLGGYVFRNGYPFLHDNGLNSVALGSNALISNTTGGNNTAIGSSALLYNTTGSNNTATGAAALSSNEGGFGNTAFGASALQSTTSGVRNTAIGVYTLQANTTGQSNTAVGRGALSSNSSGMDNTALGSVTLALNSTGYQNTAVGSLALLRSTTAYFNTAVGAYALGSVETSSRNTAIGALALESATGFRNIGLGYFAGADSTTGNNNIFIGNQGASGDSGVIKIGQFQTATFIDGIFGATASGGSAVFVNSSNQLGTLTSSRRYKEEIEDMAGASGALLALRPVTFRYTEAAAGDGPRPVEFGLIAEEVAEIYPDLVVYDEQGEPYSVRYQVLAPMLLNEVQRLRRELDALRREVARE